MTWRDLEAHAKNVKFQALAQWCTIVPILWTFLDFVFAIFDFSNYPSFLVQHINCRAENTTMASGTDLSPDATSTAISSSIVPEHKHVGSELQKYNIACQVLIYVIVGTCMLARIYTKTIIRPGLLIEDCENPSTPYKEILTCSRRLYTGLGQIVHMILWNVILITWQITASALSGLALASKYRRSLSRSRLYVSDQVGWLNLANDFEFGVHVWNVSVEDVSSLARVSPNSLVKLFCSNANTYADPILRGTALLSFGFSDQGIASFAYFAGFPTSP